MNVLNVTLYRLGLIHDKISVASGIVKLKPELESSCVKPVVWIQSLVIFMIIIIMSFDAFRGETLLEVNRGVCLRSLQLRVYTFAYLEPTAFSK